MQNAPPQGGGVKGLASKLMSFVTQDTSSAQLVDHLSELFVSIGNLCKEQFHVIRCVSLIVACYQPLLKIRPYVDNCCRYFQKIQI